MKHLIYCPDLNPVTGSVNASLLVMQLEYWFQTTEGKPFYKFLEPCESARYKVGDSWCEEMGLSKREFRSAFAAIGKVYKSKSAYVASKDNFEEKYYLSYYDRLQKCTFYVRNDSAVDALLRNVKSASGYLQEDTLHTSLSSQSQDSKDLSSIPSEATVMTLFTQHCPSLSEHTRFTTTCKKRLQALVPHIEAKGLPLLATLKQVFTQTESSDYLCGRTRGGTWRAFLSWILRPDKFFDILSGKYAPFKSASSTSHTHSSKCENMALPKWRSTFNRMENHNFDIVALESRERAFHEAKYFALQA